MSLLDDSYINTEHVPTIGERNLMIRCSVKSDPSLTSAEYFGHQEMVMALVNDIKAGHSLKVRHLDPLIKRHFPEGKYKFNIQTNFRTLIINIAIIEDIFNCRPIADVTIKGIENGAGYN